MKNEDDEIKNKKGNSYSLIFMEILILFGLIGSKDTHISKQIQTLKTTLNQTTQNIKQLDAATRQRKAQQEQVALELLCSVVNWKTLD